MVLTTWIIHPCLKIKIIINVVREETSNWSFECQASSKELLISFLHVLSIWNVKGNWTSTLQHLKQMLCNWAFNAVVCSFVYCKIIFLCSYLSDLVESFFSTMEKTGADFTNSFRCLSRLPTPSTTGFAEKLKEVQEYLVSQCCTAEDLKRANRPRMDPR